MLVDCPECGARGSVDADATGFSVCCQCGLLVTLSQTRTRSTEPGPKSAAVGSPSVPFPPADGRLVATAMRQSASAAGGGGESELVPGEHAEYAGDAPNLANSSGVFQSALMPNRPLHSTLRGKQSQAQGSIGKVPGNLRGSRPGHKSWMAVNGYIHMVVSRLSLPHAYESSVFVVVRDFLGETVRATQRTRLIVGAAVYYVARCQNEPLTMVDVADTLGVEVFRVGRYFSRLCLSRRQAAVGEAGAVRAASSATATTTPLSEEEEADDAELAQDAEFVLGGIESDASADEYGGYSDLINDHADKLTLPSSASPSAPLSSVQIHNIALQSTPLLAGGLPVVDPSMLVPRAVNALWEFANMQQQKAALNVSANRATPKRFANSEPSLAISNSGTAFSNSDQGIASTRARLFSHPWMARCPYSTKRELTDAAMRVVAIAKRGWVASGRRPAAVAVAAVAIAARFPIQAWKARLRLNVNGRSISRKLRNEQFDSLNWLATRLLVGCTTAQDRYVELRQALLQCCQDMLPWGGTVSSSNMDEHLPDLIVFETTRHMLADREKEEEREIREVDTGRSLVSGVRRQSTLPTVRDTRTDFLGLDFDGKLDVQDRREDDMSEEILTKYEQTKGREERENIAAARLPPPRAFKRGLRAWDHRADMVTRARKRARGDADNAPQDAVDEVLDKLVSAGASDDLLTNVAFQIENEAAVQHVLASLAEKSTDGAESASSRGDLAGSTGLDTILSPSEISEYVRPENEVSKLRHIWDSRNRPIVQVLPTDSL